MTNSRNLFSRVYRKAYSKQTQVLGLLASPRKDGNTGVLLDAALESAQQKGALTEKIIINGLNFIPCQACENTLDNGRCKIQDDFQKIYDAVLNADSIIVASPIYFGSISAQLKMAIDRFQCLWQARHVNNVNMPALKQGGFICVQAASRMDFFDNAKAIIKNFFATAGIEYTQETFCFDLDKKASVHKQPACIEKAAALGETLALPK